jgi:hypothetical protein
MTDHERIAVLPNDLRAIERFVEERAQSKHGAAA